MVDFLTATVVLLYLLAGIMTCKAWILTFGDDRSWELPSWVGVMRFLVWPLAAVVVLSSSEKSR